MVASEGQNEAMSPDTGIDRKPDGLSEAVGTEKVKAEGDRQ